MKMDIVFSNHALTQMRQRGVSKQEAIEAIKTGEEAPAKSGRMAFRKNFAYESKWAGNLYRVKQVMPIVVIEKNTIVVITVYSFYF